MVPVRSSSLALVPPPNAAPREARSPEEPSGQERRLYVRVDPSRLADPLMVRVKYGKPVTVVDLSAGGALLESEASLRPDSTLILEITGGGLKEPISVVSRVLRCQAAKVGGSLRYRGACVFKRTLDIPALAAEPAPSDADPLGAGRPEFALKRLVDAYRRRSRVSRITPSDAYALLEALARLRTAAEGRPDPVDRSLAEMLGAVATVLARNDAADDPLGEVLIQLARFVPALTIRVGGGARPVGGGDAERLTLNVWPESGNAATLTAEYPAGFDVDDKQLRFLRMGAYLLGLADTWSATAPLLAATPFDPAEAEAQKDENGDLPAGWHRVVIRFADGELLRGYSRNFHPDSPHMHLSPDIQSPEGERLFVPVTRLKAVFFVRDLAGNAEHVDCNVFDHTPRGRKVEITFRDGEVMTGSTLNYKPGGQGFFLAPASSRGNNQRVYVVLAAVRHMRFL